MLVSCCVEVINIYGAKPNFWPFSQPKVMKMKYKKCNTLMFDSQAHCGDR